MHAAAGIGGARSRWVLFFSDAPYEGGAERYIEYLIDAFPPGWRAEVIARQAPSLDRWARRLNERGVPVHRAADSQAGLLRTLWRTIREAKPTIVHLNLPHSYSAAYSLAAPVARLAGAHRIVSTEHLTMIAPMRARGVLRREASRSIARIITLSESNRGDLERRHHLPASRVRVVMNGVPDLPPVSNEERARARAALGAADGEVCLVHVGALTARKGQGLLLSALATLVDRPWHLAFVGEGEDEGSLRAQADAASLTGRVTFTGRREDIPAVLAAADVVVLPSSLEGIPLVLLEALAAGRPAVASAIYGVPEIYGGADAAILIPPHDRDALARALERLVADPSLRRRMGEDARALYLRRFTARRMAHDTVCVYEEIAS